VTKTYHGSKFLTPKAKSNRKRQLERSGYDDDTVADIIDFEFDLGLGRYPGTPLPGKSYAEGGKVESLNEAIDRVKKEQGFRNGGRVSISNFKGHF
jgi:hypothetical protein|tara:strand:- start:2245 stop:2532 length:288 start_codon:yes stop_codon:yes gene_type:complete